MVALQLSSNCCSFIVIFAALSSATLKRERALTITVLQVTSFFMFWYVVSKVASLKLKIWALLVIRSNLNFQRMLVSKLNSNVR